MTKTLTEKWKDEQLEDGFYWLKVNVGGGDYIDIVKYNSADVDFVRYYNDCIKEVIGKVPSYEEYTALKDVCAMWAKEVGLVEMKGKVK